ncbi:hypothetical protein [Streptomyces sp. NPDC002044]|uniref:hypothetical protein n=1 Tax=Streptomyces sp. NPDC002044 TaxID=3154662 RepID=UPI003324A577
MSANPQYPATGRPVTTDDLLAALLPDTPAAALGSTSAAPAAAPAPGFDIAALLELARRQGALEAAVAQQTPARPAVADKPRPVVPRWAIGTAVAGLGIGAGGLLLGVALDLLAAGAAAIAAGISAAAPMLILGAILLAAVVGGRRKSGGPLEITQHVAVSVTQAIKGGRR